MVRVGQRQRQVLQCTVDAVGAQDRDYTASVKDRVIVDENMTHQASLYLCVYALAFGMDTLITFTQSTLDRVPVRDSPAHSAAHAPPHIAPQHKPLDTANSILSDHSSLVCSASLISRSL